MQASILPLKHMRRLSAASAAEAPGFRGAQDIISPAEQVIALSSRM